MVPADEDAAPPFTVGTMWRRWRQVDSGPMATLPTAAAPAAASDRADAIARAAAAGAGVEVRLLQGVDQLAEAADLAARVWRAADTSALDTSLLRALSHTQNYVAGAFDAGELVGLSVGFRTGDAVPTLHSHMTGTAEHRRSGGLGLALKLHQRAWALAAGLATVTWTFDPLARQNAYFNLVKLGAVVEQYLPDFYGPMDDGLNTGDESDRLLMTWAVTDGPITRGPSTFEAGEHNVRLVSTPEHEPRRLLADTDVAGCQVPPDIVALRGGDPALARRWRHALRATLVEAFADGYRIAGFSRAGFYVLRRGDAPPGTAAAGG
jgi:predicted GNAT superfamily acetyltransferase